jgi:hypothetical protein
MKNLRDELNEVINSENIQEISFLRLNEWQWVLNQLAENFLANGAKDLNRIWLWESIKEPYSSFQPDDAIAALKGLLQPQESYFFIASDEDGKYWVLKGNGAAIVTLVAESHAFEYYISNLSISWLLCENHHGVIVSKGNIQGLSKYA